MDAYGSVFFISGLGFRDFVSDLVQHPINNLQEATRS